MGKPEGRRPLGRLGRRWEDNIKIDLQEKIKKKVFRKLGGRHGLDRSG